MRTFTVILASVAAGYLIGARDLRPDVMRADRAFDLAVSKQGVDAWVSFFAEDGAMSKSDGEVVRGRTAIRALMSPLFEDENSSLRWQPDFAEVAKSGDLAYTTGEALLRGKNAEGRWVERESRYLTIWKRQRDGEWKVAFDIGMGGRVRAGAGRR